MARRLLLVFSSVFLTLFMYAVVLRPVLYPYLKLPALIGGHMHTLVLFMFSLTHAWYMLGWRHTLVFAALSTVISWGYEQIGVVTGWVYGSYHYTDALGMKLGHVPLLIPVAWFMMIYPSYVITNLISDDQPTGSRGGFFRIAWLSISSAAVMTAWDLVMDPQMSGPGIKAWIWEKGGQYFGVPLQNFLGWMFTTFTVYLIYRVFESKVKLRPIGQSSRAIAVMPLLAYGSMMFSMTRHPDPQALRVIGLFAMGLPLAFAFSRLYKQKKI